MSAHELHVLVDTLAWTLIHFLWQGALVALVLWLGLAALGGATARVRYLVRCAALIAMAVAPVVTFAWLWGDAPALPELPVVTTAAGLALPESAEDAVQSLWSQPLAWVVLVWCVGAALCVLRFGGGLLQVVRLRRKNVGIDLAPRWQRRFDALAREFGVRATARVVESAAVCVPAVIGCLKPVVLLPARLFSGLSDEQIEALIAHELAHVVRHDYLVNIAQSIVEALLFYHPAVWWVSRGIRVEREYCCDDLAVAATRNGLSYAHALATLEAWRGAQPQLGVSTLGGSLLSRIQRLVGLEPERPRRALRPAHAVAGLFVAGTLGASAFAFATQPDPASCDCKCSCHRKAHAQDRAVDVLEDVTLMPAPSGRAIYSRVPIVDYYFGGGELHEGDDAAARMQVQNRFYGVDAPQDDQRVRVIVKTIDSEGHETVSEGTLGDDGVAQWFEEAPKAPKAPKAKQAERRFVVKGDLDRLKQLETDGEVKVEGDEYVVGSPTATRRRTSGMWQLTLALSRAPSRLRPLLRRAAMR
ncbi:MAG: M56 family metallopeptidase [Planctomycetes bacterium]|nr:M56 family metallopeptidase [Planctomycetota bacterium]